MRSPVVRPLQTATPRQRQMPARGPALPGTASQQVAAGAAQGLCRRSRAVGPHEGADRTAVRTRGRPAATQYLRPDARYARIRGVPAFRAGFDVVGLRPTTSHAAPPLTANGDGTGRPGGRPLQTATPRQQHRPHGGAASPDGNGTATADAGRDAGAPRSGETAANDSERWRRRCRCSLEGRLYVAARSCQRPRQRGTAALLPLPPGRINDHGSGGRPRRCPCRPVVGRPNTCRPSASGRRGFAIACPPAPLPPYGAGGQVGAAIAVPVCQLHAQVR